MITHEAGILLKVFNEEKRNVYQDSVIEAGFSAQYNSERLWPGSNSSRGAGDGGAGDGSAGDGGSGRSHNYGWDWLIHGEGNSEDRRAAHPGSPADVCRRAEGVFCFAGGEYPIYTRAIRRRTRPNYGRRPGGRDD